MSVSKSFCLTLLLLVISCAPSQQASQKSALPAGSFPGDAAPNQTSAFYGRYTAGKNQVFIAPVSIERRIKFYEVEVAPLQVSVSGDGGCNLEYRNIGAHNYRGRIRNFAQLLGSEGCKEFDELHPSDGSAMLSVQLTEFGTYLFEFGSVNNGSFSRKQAIISERLGDGVTPQFVRSKRLYTYCTKAFNNFNGAFDHCRGDNSCRIQTDAKCRNESGYDGPPII